MTYHEAMAEILHLINGCRFNVPDSHCLGVKDGKLFCLRNKFVPIGSTIIKKLTGTEITKGCDSAMWNYIEAKTRTLISEGKL